MQTDTPPLPSVGIIGGTGALGRGLAARWAGAGLSVSVGSRHEGRATETAAEITGSYAASNPVTGADLRTCASSSDIVVVAVPWDAHADTVEQIRDAALGKIVIDVVVPLGFDKNGPYAHRVAEGSAAEQAQSLLPDSHVVAAFHHVSAALLTDPALERVETDVMVLGDDAGSVRRVQELVDLIPGMRGIHAGRLRNAGQVEALTANLIAVNRRYKTHAGIGLTNVSGAAGAQSSKAALVAS
jgi:8-hydroxy-5-deazaflavin:NADPH oxidoreductase